jgi:catechol 2,3-dioxygenase-like lactoylglutathione lyase family enzyme
MRRVLLLTSIAFVGLVVNSTAQTPILPLLDHIHLLVPDQAAGVEWYQKAFGGEKMNEAPDRLMFGETRLIFLRNPQGKPSNGSTIDHIGFSVPDLDGKLKELEAAGAKILNPGRDVAGLFKLAFVEDPWGTKIEVVQDPETPGLHHVHLRGPNAAEALSWYSQKFGGESGKLKGRIDGLKFGKVWLLAQAGEAVPSDGHAIDHIGFRTTDLTAKTAEFKAQNVKFTTEPRPLKLASGAVVNFAYLESPIGAKVELVQR